MTKEEIAHYESVCRWNRFIKIPCLLQGDMTYMLTGRGLADYMFSLNDTTGEIILRRNIRGSNLDRVNQYTVSDIFLFFIFLCLESSQDRLVKL